MIGESIGRYHVLEQLGEGGMAMVYRAYDTRLDRDVALKVILPMRQQAPKFLTRFEREAKALASLSHPNIVKVLDYGEHEGLPYLVMEYVPAGILKAKLGKPMPSPEAASLLEPIAQALDYAHSQKFVHRDVKPSNILISQAGQPMLSDFGIAKVLESEETSDLTGTGVGIGTPEYMAPEQGAGKTVDHRADIYALGVVLYELVTGRTPFQADTPLAVLLKHMNDPLPRPRDIVGQIPRDVERVIFKALAKQPENRLSDMATFAELLSQVAGGQKVGISGLTQVPGARRLMPAQLAAVAAVAVLLGVGALWVLGGLGAFGESARIFGAAGQATDTPGRTSTADLTQAVEVVQQLTAMARAQLDATATMEGFEAGQTATVVALTPEATPTSTSTPTATMDADPLVFDNFDHADFDGTYQSGLWSQSGSPNVKAAQSDGLLVIKVTPVPQGVTNYRMTVRQPLTFPITSDAFLEARMMIAGDHVGQYMNATFGFETRLDGEIWWSQCGMAASTGGPEAYCEVNNWTRDQFPEIQPLINLRFDQWYVLRMEISAEDFEVSFYLDDQLIGRLIPSDAERLQTARFSRHIYAYIEPNTAMTANFDYVRTTP